MMEQHNLVEILQNHASNHPHKPAINLLTNQNLCQVESQITFGELFVKAYQLGFELQEKAPVGARVVLCYPTGVDFVVALYACWFARLIAVPVMVPGNAYLARKFTGIVLNCHAALVLTDTATYPVLATHALPKHTLLYDTQIALLPAVPPVEVTLPVLRLDELALLQYTSGSTSEPKGVMITHGNLVHNIQAIMDAYQTNEHSVGLSWLPHTHDMGLIGAILHATYSSGTFYLCSPIAFLRRPTAWLQALSHFKIQVAGGPCFALKLCLNQLKPDLVDTLDLCHVKQLIIGSEPITPGLIDDFYAALAPAKLARTSFFAAYGLAESTLMVSVRNGLKTRTVETVSLSQQVAQEAYFPSSKTTTITSCGFAHETLRIVSPKTLSLCEDNQVGEIWLQGPSVATGYWGNQALTDSSFLANTTTDHSHYLRTGDLGFCSDKELYVIGRLKDVIIINGLNYYPHDIEQQLTECDDALARATVAVFSFQPPNAVTDSFVVLIKPAKRLTPEQETALGITVRKTLLRQFSLVPYDLQFVPIALPKTTSGKLQRHACRDYYVTQCILPNHRATHVD